MCPTEATESAFQKFTFTSTPKLIGSSIGATPKLNRYLQVREFYEFNKTAALFCSLPFSKQFFVSVSVSNYNIMNPLNSGGFQVTVIDAPGYQITKKIWTFPDGTRQFVKDVVCIPVTINGPTKILSAWVIPSI